ncbi:hypothetical protein OTK49_20880 [Vibrio coralliirubri]|uniref:hypothetical protein n=1 Tax=Vibrio coralliirubri TaxID=1516159 RepID=UPI002283CC8E|nr:hypothetical protein [Vibrio coralliirubri]MCY9864974.1 hypothetical protein [Vibrio coralliirubri]
MDAPMSRYALVIDELTKELGHLVFWRTNKGDASNQMYKLLGVSRSSHSAYLDSDEAVPKYIWNHLEALQAMSANKRYEMAYHALVNPSNLTVKSSLEMAIKGWEELTGRDFDDISGSDFAGRFSARRANEDMGKVAKDDESGIAVGLMLQGYLTRLGNSLDYDFAEVFNDSTTLQRQLRGFARAKMFLSDTPLGDAISEFRKICINAVKFYKPDSSISDDLLESAIHLMLDAKRTYRCYPKYQVSSDALESNNTTLKLQEQVFVFESISDLVEHSALLPNGFSLSLIRTARPTDSFFCVIVKSGGNIHLLTDKPRYSEFEKDAMSARNQRYNVMRFESSYMPYYFIEMNISDNDRIIEMSDSKTLTTTKDGLRVLGHFKDMPQESILWFTFLIEECRNDFFSGVTTSFPKLGYVNQLTLEHALLGATSGVKQLPSTFVSNGVIEQKSSAQLDRPNLLKGFGEGVCSTLMSKNRWMEEKYDHLIDDSVLYIPESLSETLVLENKTTGVITLESSEGESTQTENKFGVSLKRLPSTMLGSPEAVQAEADLIARYNKSLIIAKLMKDDYLARQSEVKTWISKQIKRNLPTLVDRLVSLDHEYFFIAHKANQYRAEGAEPQNHSWMLRQIHVAKARAMYDPRTERTELQKVLAIRDTNNNTKCAMTKYRYPAYTFYLNVDCIYDLEILTGLTRDKFPVELQNWRSRSDLVADRRSHAYDPIEALANPWGEMEFLFAINLDEEYVRQRRKELGVKGRFIMPKNYYEDEPMLNWLKEHQLVDGVQLVGRVRYEKPSWSYYFMG